MSTAEGWDFTVPDNEAELLAELRRHGVLPGKRFHVVEAVDAGPMRREADPRPDAQSRSPRRLRFTGMISAEPDLSENFDHYLEQSYGQD